MPSDMRPRGLPWPSPRIRCPPFRTPSSCGSRALTLLWLRGFEGCRRASTSEGPSRRALPIRISRCSSPICGSDRVTTWQALPMGAPRAPKTGARARRARRRGWSRPTARPSSSRPRPRARSESSSTARSRSGWSTSIRRSGRSPTPNFNGPARVRGGPGTGKTVVALHRARVLARKRVEAPDKVLLTTFLSTLPKVWTSLMGLLDRAALQRLDIRNIDQLARELVAADAHGGLAILDAASRPKTAEGAAEATRTRQGDGRTTRSSCSTSSMRSSPVAASRRSTSTLRCAVAAAGAASAAPIASGYSPRSRSTERRCSSEGLTTGRTFASRRSNSPRAAPVRGTTGSSSTRHKISARSGCACSSRSTRARTTATS